MRRDLCGVNGEGQGQNQIADDLRPAIEAVLDDLERWLTPTADEQASGRELRRTSRMRKPNPAAPTR
jgi:hypothetical protein